MIGRLGSPTVDELMRCIRRHGKADGVLESAWALPLRDFRVVEEAWRRSSQVA